MGLLQKIRYFLPVILSFLATRSYSSSKSFGISADANLDGKITISDIGDWINWFFCLPGNSAIYLMLDKFPKSAQFFELSIKDYNGTASTVISILIWLIIFGVINQIPDKIGGSKNDPE